MATYYLLMPGTLLRSGDLLDNPPNVGEGRGAPPLITVDTTGRTGQPLLVFGTDGVSSWWVRGARGSVIIDRSSYHLSDPLAPLNVPAAYYIVSPDGTETMVTQAVRGFAGADLLTDLDGIHGVEFDRMDNADPRSPGLNVELFHVPGREPLPRYQPATTGTFTVLARTEGQTTGGLRDMLARSPLAVVLHNPAVCRIPHCDVPRVQSVAVTSAPNQRVGTVDVSRRDWSLSTVVADDPYADILAPLSTVGMHDAYHAGLTVAEHDALYAGNTVAEVDRMVWA